MRPTLPRLYSADGALSYCVLGGYFLLKSRVVSYLHNLRGSQFRSPAAFASIGSAVFRSVHLICRRSVPPKIAKAIVRWIAIVMAPLTTARRWTTESKQNQPAYSTRFVDVVFPKKQHVASVFFVNGGFLDVACFRSSHAASIGDFVNALKTNNMFPLFHKTSITPDMVIVP